MPVPVINVAQMREWEQASWAAGRVESAVIERVGLAVARRALQLTAAGGQVLLLAGKGHNGDDVRLATPHLAGREATLINVHDPVAALPELASALARHPRLIVDGLFGIGLNRPLAGAWAALVEKINDSRVPVLAVDVPSGLSAATGEALGVAIRATTTLTVGAPKCGLLAAGAIAHVGRLEVAAEVGLLPCPFKSELNWIMPGDFEDFPPPRETTGHKGTYGHLAIVAGSPGYHGAAVLSARAAARAMPGLISVLTPPSVYVPVAGQLAAAMVHPLRLDHPLLEEADALLAGPGLVAPDGLPETRRRIQALWRSARQPMVVDASALDWLPADAAKLPGLRVITPHPGEAARMLGTTVAAVQGDRVHSLRELSRRFGNCWVVLKGHQTLIGRSAGDIAINSSGNPGLAQGGTGDVLAGYLAGLLAEPHPQDDRASRTIGFAVWEHGATADVLAATRRAWTVEDLLSNLGNSRPT